jgi:uncharacterized protein with HEPN domain
MDRKAAKELLHIQGWLERVDAIIQRGKDAYLADDLLQEAGDSLMMKLGEAANRLSRLGVLAPDGVEWALAVANRNFIIHQYDEINRDLTWLTLREISLPGGHRWNRCSRKPRRRSKKSPAEDDQSAASTAYETPPHPVALRVDALPARLRCPPQVLHHHRLNTPGS